jgi:hypothetical protein
VYRYLFVPRAEDDSGPEGSNGWVEGVGAHLLYDIYDLYGADTCLSQEPRMTVAPKGLMDE